MTASDPLCRGRILGHGSRDRGGQHPRPRTGSYTGTDRFFRVDLFHQAAFFQPPLGQTQVFGFTRLQGLGIVGRDETDRCSFCRVDDLDEIPLALVFIDGDNVFFLDREFVFGRSLVRVQNTCVRDRL
jgi:hypothetical protein